MFFHRYALCCLSCLALFIEPARSQAKTDTFFQQLLEGNTNNIFRQVLQHPDIYRLQIIYTQIERDRNNRPSFKNYYYHYDPDLYFNPASMVKLPLALLSLEKLHAIKQPGVNKYTTILFDSSKPWQRPLYHDTTAANGLPAIGHFIRRALLISENDPYNRMYQFVGQAAINRNLHTKGYKDIRITRQFLGLTTLQNRYTPAIRFVNQQGKLLYYQPPDANTDSFNFKTVINLGQGFYNNHDSLVHEPYDFTRHNNLPLENMQQLLQSALFPASVPAKQRFRLDDDDYAFLHRYFSQYPSETSYPKYDTSLFYDSYVKFFFRDSTHHMPQHIRVFNKVGWSYGFLTDVSYVADFRHHIEFMLSATLYVNSDNILNDDKYEYDSIGHPFLYQLGQTILHYELQRKRKYKPDLSAFNIPYEHRSPQDTRPSLKEVDN